MFIEKSPSQDYKDELGFVVYYENIRYEAYWSRRVVREFLATAKNPTGIKLQLKKTKS